jgi:outer membrane protein OmpA-like peptidoglycan-associated protein
MMITQVMKFIFFAFFLVLQPGIVFAQQNLLLNGGFEEVNTCTEYKSECGVEAWFYLKDVKAQMLSNEGAIARLGTNSFGLYFTWNGYTDFSPLIGALLPCGLQKDKRYFFKGLVSAKLNPRLILLPGIVTGNKFYVPKRSFVSNMEPDSINELAKVPNTDFFEFEYSFVATGKERYLTFGTYIKEDSTGGKKKLIGTQTISVLLDNFELTSQDGTEVPCKAFEKNKNNIYSFNFRHKEMDYSLYGKGELKIPIEEADSNYITQKAPEAEIWKADTLKLGDVFFDFNKAVFKPGAEKMLETFFGSNGAKKEFDRIYIEGHTDSIGSDQQNLELSQARCETVQLWMQQQNIPNEKIEIHPFGKSRPVAPNHTAKGRSLNRRVEIIILRKEGKTTDQP